MRTRLDPTLGESILVSLPPRKCRRMLNRLPIYTPDQPVATGALVFPLLLGKPPARSPLPPSSDGYP